MIAKKKKDYTIVKPTYFLTEFCKPQMNAAKYFVKENHCSSHKERKWTGIVMIGPLPLSQSIVLRTKK